MKKILLLESCDIGIILFKIIFKKYNVTEKKDLCNLEDFLRDKKFDLVVMELNNMAKDKTCSNLTPDKLVEFIERLAHCPVILWTTHRELKQAYPRIKMLVKPAAKKELRMLVEANI